MLLYRLTVPVALIILLTLTSGAVILTSEDADTATIDPDKSSVLSEETVISPEPLTVDTRILPAPLADTLMLPAPIVDTLMLPPVEFNEIDEPVTPKLPNIETAPSRETVPVA